MISKKTFAKIATGGTYVLEAIGWAWVVLGSLLTLLAVFLTASKPRIGISLSLAVGGLGYLVSIALPYFGRHVLRHFRSRLVAIS
jgi:hypothetical protein